MIKVKTKVSLFSAILLSTTTMVGSGWLFSSQLTAGLAGNWAFLAWILTAIIVIATGMCYSKVISRFPVCGATTRMSSFSHNHVFAMPFAFANWFGIVVFISSEALATTQYLSGTDYFSSLMTNNGLTWFGLVFSAMILFMYLMINFYGIKWLSRINNGIIIFKICVPTIIIVSFLYAGFSKGSSNFTVDIPNYTYNYMDAFTAITAGGLIYTFNGFQTIAAYGSEIKNPSRNIPLAIVLSVIVVLALYLGLQYAFMEVVPYEYLVKNGWSGLNFKSPLLQVATILAMNYIVVLLLIDSVVSRSGAGYGYLGSSSRMLYGMAREEQAPKYFANINKEFNFPRRSLIANFLLTVFFLIFAKNWATLMLVVTAFNILGYMAAPISMGAIFPKSKWFGLIVFIVLGLVFATLNLKTSLLVNVMLITLMAIYTLIERKRMGLKNIMVCVLPFFVFLLIISFIKSYIFDVTILVIFYLLATNKTYVNFCKNLSNNNY